MSIVRRLFAPAVAGAIAFVLDFLMFFFVWAESDAVQAVRHPFWQRIAWSIISFPVFSVAPKNLTTEYFWQLGFINVSLWACMATFLAWRLGRREVA